MVYDLGFVPPLRLYFRGSVRQVNITINHKTTVEVGGLSQLTFSTHLRRISRALTSFPESSTSFSSERSMANTTVFGTIILFAGAIATTRTELVPYLMLAESDGRVVDNVYQPGKVQMPE